MFEENSFTQQNEPDFSEQISQEEIQKPDESISQQKVLPKYYFEKKDIQKSALAIGLACICMPLISNLWSKIYVGFGFTFGSNPAIQQIIQICFSMIIFLVPFPLMAKCAGYKINDIINAGRPKKGTGIALTLFGIGFCAFANIVMSYCASFFDGIGIEYDVPYGRDPEGTFGFLLSFIATAIVPSLVEEFACRGIILGMLRKYGDAFAIIASSIVFGIMHGNFDQIPFATMVGLVLGYIYVKTGSLWISMSVHFVNNAISVVFTNFASRLDINTQNLLYIVYLMIALITAIFGICLLSRKNSDGFGIPKSTSIGSEKQKHLWFFTSWAIILFVAINIYESITYFNF